MTRSFVSIRLSGTVRLSDGWLALQKPSTPRDRAERGTVRGVEYVQEWDVWTLQKVKVATAEQPAGQWWPVAMWEVTG